MSQTRPFEVMRAAAGAGKTFALSNRFIALLRRGVRPEAILATTFTRKAAGEILERVLRRLADAARDKRHAATLADQLDDGSLSLDDCRAMLAAVCQALHRVSICTIDSFFNRVGSSFRYELGIPPRATMVGDDDPRVRQLRASAIEAVLADDDPQVLVDLLRRLHHDTAKRSVTQAIDDIIGRAYQIYRDAPDRAVWTRVEPPDTLDAVALRSAIDALMNYAAAFTGHVKLADAMRQTLEAANAGDWKALLGISFVKGLLQGKTDYHRKPLDEALIAAFEPLIEHAQAQAVSYCLYETAATFDLLTRFDVHYTDLRHRHHVLLFHDLPRKLARELPQHDQLMSDVYFRLDAAVEHLLLDEFQDTSIDQWTVLRPFAEEIRAYGDGSRTFFCVGDVKQAIYGWRGGCAEIFDRIETDLQLDADAVERRNLNYRSSPVVIDVVNQVFEDITDNPALDTFAALAKTWATGFETHLAHHADRAGYVELLESPRAEDDASADNLDDDTDTGDDEPGIGDAHLFFAAERIAHLTRDAPGRSIGVLLRQTKDARDLLHHLHLRGIVASGESGNLLTDDPAVNVILAAMTLADHPGDKVAAFHVLNSPLARVVGLASAEPRDTRPAGGRIRAALLDHGYARTISDWAHELAPFGGERTAGRLTQLVELADTYDPALTLRPSHFVDYAAATEVEELAPANVRIMTIHASKGLEFDIVVLPDLDRAMVRVGPRSMYVLRQSETAPIAAVFRGTNEQVRQRVDAIEAAYRQEEARSFRDAMCVLYVAMTRARHALHMIVKPVKLRKGGEPTQAKSPTYARVLRAALAEPWAGDANGRPLFAHGDPSWHQRDAQAQAVAQPTPGPVLHPRIALTSSHTRRSRAQVAPSSLEGAGRISAADLLGLTPSAGRERGSVLHAWLQQITYLDGSDRPPMDDAMLRDVADRAAPGMDAAAIEHYRAQFMAMLSEPTIVDALRKPDTNHVELWQERPFAVVIDDRLMRGVFDRVVVHHDEAGPARAELVDFKTDRATDLTLDTTVDTYRPQLRAYRRALANLLGIDTKSITTSLLFVSTAPPRRVEVT